MHGLYSTEVRQVPMPLIIIAVVVAVSFVAIATITYIVVNSH